MTTTEARTFEDCADARLAAEARALPADSPEAERTRTLVAAGPSGPLAARLAAGRADARDLWDALTSV